MATRECIGCGSNFARADTGMCGRCFNVTEREIAQTTVLGHLRDALGCLFNFEFMGVFAELMWAFQRATQTGDYAEDGEFTRRGINWREPFDKSTDHRRN